MSCTNSDLPRRCTPAGLDPPFERSVTLRSKFVSLIVACGAVIVWGCQEEMSHAELTAHLDSTFVGLHASDMASEQAWWCRLLEDPDLSSLSEGLIEEYEVKCQIFTSASSEAARFQQLWYSGSRPDGFAFEFWFYVDIDHWNNITVGPFLSLQLCQTTEALARPALIPTNACRSWRPVQF